MFSILSQQCGFTSHIKSACIFYRSYNTTYEWNKENISFYKVMMEKTSSKDHWYAKFKKWFQNNNHRRAYSQYIKNCATLPKMLSDNLRLFQIKLLANGIPTACRMPYLKMENNNLKHDEYAIVVITFGAYKTHLIFINLPANQSVVINDIIS